MVRKKSSSEVSQFTFDKHDYAARVDTARTHQPAFAAEHAFVHLLVGTLILAAADERVNLAEIELREISGRADRRAGPASDAGLQLRHFVQDFVALAQVVAVDVDRPRLGDGISEIDRRHTLCPQISGRSVGSGRCFVQRFADILRRRDGSGVKNALHVALHVAQEHVARRHETARRSLSLLLNMRSQPSFGSI